MSRPQDLPALLKAWALANYSAGPAWGGTAQRQAPGSAALVPGVSLPAEVLNYLHGFGFDAAQGAINAVGQLPALNWLPSLALPSTSRFLAWSDAEQAWYAGPTGSPTAIARSPDYGKSWISGGVTTFTAQPIMDMAFDVNGAAVVINSAGNVLEGALTYGTILTLTQHSAVTVFTGNSPLQVAYEPSSGLWCVLGSTSTPTASVFTSPDRITWTARALTANWSGTGNLFPTMGVGNGLVVLASPFSSSTIHTIRSSNGGVTWTNDTSIAVNAGITVATAARITVPTWSAVDKLWYLAVGQTGTRKTQVFSSPDAITWSSAATLLANDCNFVGLMAIGALLIAVNDDGRIFCSMNQGANWFRCGSSASVTNATPFYAAVAGQGVRAGGGGLIVLGNSGANATASQRFGLPTQAA